MQKKKGLCRITFYLEDSPDGYNTLAQVRMALSRVKQEHPEYGRLLLTMENMEDADWENNWKQFYKPMEIGDRLTVIPEWESAGVPEGRVALRLNPGLTFGTGSHATTRLCLTALEKHITGGQTVLDLGCGSGILSIAALLLGADRAVACDIDEKCMDVAYENAALNGVGRDRYTVRWGDVVTDQALRQELGGPYDVVVANIVADVIKALASTVRPLVKEGASSCAPASSTTGRRRWPSACGITAGPLPRPAAARAGSPICADKIKTSGYAGGFDLWRAGVLIQAAAVFVGDTPMTSRKARANLLALS